MRNEPTSDPQLIREIEQFLYREARLLDDRRFRDWLELFCDDVHYWMTSRTNRYPKNSKAIAILDPDRYVEDDTGADDELAILDETKETLTARVDRLDTGPPLWTFVHLALVQLSQVGRLSNDPGVLTVRRVPPPRPAGPGDRRAGTRAARERS